MPRYFFNVYDGFDFFDNVGTDCLDMKAVHQHMFYVAVDMMGNKEHKKEQWKIEAVDEAGKIVANMDFGITKARKIT